MTSRREHETFRHRLPLSRTGTPRAFFGRRSGKRLHGGQQGLMDTLLPALAISLPEVGMLSLPELFPAPPRQMVIEIGYGGGEHLARQAEARSETGFIGCEVFTGGIAKLLDKIAAQGLGNIRLFTDDALKLLQRLPEASIDEVYLLYPDPWPKSRHSKRRFVSAVTLAELARVMRPGGVLRVATDIADYADWTLAQVLRAPAFLWVPGSPGSWHEPFPGWQPTRYEEKARAEGRSRSFYFTFRRQ